MNKPLKKNQSVLYWFDADGNKQYGSNPRLLGTINPSLHGDCTLLYGDCSGLHGDCTRLRGDYIGLHGDCSGLYGDCIGLHGDCTGLYGNCSGVSGNCTDIPESARPCNIADWVQ